MNSAPAFGPEDTVPSPGASPATSMDRRLAPRRMKAWRPALLAAGAVLLALAGFAAWRLLPGNGDLVLAGSDVTTAMVSRASFEDALPLRAAAAPLVTVQVVAVEGGQVQSVVAQDGADVVAGQPLAVLSNPRLRLEVASSEAQITGQLGDARGQELQLARNRLDREEAIGETAFNLLNAERELRIRSDLHAKGFVSDAGLAEVQAQAAYHRDRLARLRQAQGSEDALSARQLAGVRQSSTQLQANLGILHGSLDALTIRAPVAGRLTAFTLLPGQPLAAGATVGQVDSENAYKLVAEVDEFYLSRVAAGQPAVANIAGRAWPLTVARVLPQVTGGRFQVELTFKDATPPALRRGQTLDLRIVLGETRTALIAPAGPWLDSGGGTVAYVLDASGKRAVRRAVRLGRRSPTQVEVLEGVSPGERILTSSYQSFDGRRRLVLRQKELP
jgi:HlyD family secretion protein